MGLDPSTVVCVDCSVSLGWTPRKGQVPKRCADCLREKKRQQAAEWRARDPERARQSVRRVRSGDWYERNRDKLLAGSRAYHAAHPEKARARWEKRRALKVGSAVEGSINARDIYARDGWICQLCDRPVVEGTPWPDPWSPSLDHIVPLSKGGPHVPSNVQLAHLRCNQSKWANT